MAYDQTEAIILEQLKLGNYKLSHYFDWCFGSLELVIPKTGSNPKIVVEFASYTWDDEAEVFIPWGEAKHYRVYLKSFMNSQRITLHNEEVTDWLKDVLVNYWLLEGEKRRKEIAAEDKTWAERFKEAFK